MFAAHNKRMVKKTNKWIKGCLIGSVVVVGAVIVNYINNQVKEMDKLIDYLKDCQSGK